MKQPSSSFEELDALSDNVLMWRLGIACAEAMARHDVGDPIDRGLILLEMLRKKGFTVYVQKP